MKVREHRDQSIAVAKQPHSLALTMRLLQRRFVSGHCCASHRNSRRTNGSHYTGTGADGGGSGAGPKSKLVLESRLAHRHAIIISACYHNEMSTRTTVLLKKSSCYHHLVISTHTSSCYHHLVSSTDTSACYHNETSTNARPARQHESHARSFNTTDAMLFYGDNHHAIMILHEVPWKGPLTVKRRSARRSLTCPIRRGKSRKVLRA